MNSPTCLRIYFTLVILAFLLLPTYTAESGTSRITPTTHFRYTQGNVPMRGGDEPIPKTTIYVFNNGGRSFKFTIYGHLPATEDKMLDWIRMNSKNYKQTTIDYEPPNVEKITETTDSRRTTIDQILPEDCGYSGDQLRDYFYSKHPADRVVNGRVTPIEQHPWQVAIVSKENGYVEVTCGGSIITDKHVISAQHCFLKTQSYTIKGKRFYNETALKLSDRMIYAGGTKASDSPFRSEIKKIFPHSWYTTSHKRNDIALVMIDGVFPFSSNIFPICLPKTDYLYWPGRACNISGYGQLDQHTHNQEGTLRSADVKISTEADCHKIQNVLDDVRITGGMFCAANELSNGQVVDTCFGDSGGPLICKLIYEEKYVLFGITSFGYGCASREYPGVYTRVSMYVRWIHERLENSVNNENRAGLHSNDVGRP